MQHIQCSTDNMNRNNFFDNGNNDSCCNDDCNRRRQSNCCCEENNSCIKCVPGPPGPIGPRGPIGETGPAGGVLGYADFYALMPPDNAATVAPGTDVSFPQDGANSGESIVRTGDDSFNLTEIGAYLVTFQVSVTEAGQLILTLNGEEPCRQRRSTNHHSSRRRNKTRFRPPCYNANRIA